MIRTATPVRPVSGIPDTGRTRAAEGGRARVGGPAVGAPAGIRARDEGSVTAEFAVAMPALMVLVLAAVSCVTAVTLKLQCVAAAREAALTSARGGSGTEAGAAVAPPGADVTIDAGPTTVRATVRFAFHPLGGRLPAVAVIGEAVAATEPGMP